jgi:hypothetical protein
VPKMTWPIQIYVTPPLVFQLFAVVLLQILAFWRLPGQKRLALTNCASKWNFKFKYSARCNLAATLFHCTQLKVGYNQLISCHGLLGRLPIDCEVNGNNLWYYCEFKILPVMSYYKV